MSASINIHASCVRLADAGAAFGAPKNAGIVILGDSGAGKSALALKLIAAGAQLVADDRLELFLRNGRLHGRPPQSLAGLIEIRGVGIVELAFCKHVPIFLVARLSPKMPPRLPKPAFYTPPAGLKLARQDRPALVTVKNTDSSAPEKIAAAAAAFARALFRDTTKGL